MTVTATQDVMARPTGAVEERRALGSIEEVRYPDRIITVVAVPYNVETQRADGRFRESFAPRSFEGLEVRNGRIRVRREHESAGAVGKVEVWDSRREDALIANLSIAKTRLGDETLELAADGVLDASVGFQTYAGGEQWSENRTRRRITKAWMHHLGLTDDPAYEGAKVLEVRSVGRPGADAGTVAPTSATPAKDEMMALLRERGHLPTGYV
jgi:HK97 family phage prohead protease